LSRQEGVTLFMVVLAAFQTLLHRYSGQDDIIVGTGIANRNRAETEKLLGYFVNTLALRGNLSGNPTFREYLAHVREVALDAYAHQDMPFELLVEKLQPERSANRTPFFQVWCETQTLTGAPAVAETAGLKLSTTRHTRRSAYFDLMLFLTETDHGISGYLEYNTDLFDVDTITEMTRRFVALLECVTANPELRLLDIPLREEQAVEAVAVAAEFADDSETGEFFAFETPGEREQFAFEAFVDESSKQHKGTALSPETLRNIAIIKRVPRTERLPLSFAQQQLWFIHQLEPESAVYNVPLCVRLKGRLDVAALKHSLNEVVRRHEVLRTTFAVADGQPVQLISEPKPLPLPYVDMSLLAAAQREGKTQLLATEEAARPFDLAAGPLLRATLVRLAEEDHVVMLTMHHIVTDGWSNSVLIREVAASYTAYLNGGPSSLPELPIQYADFAHWQRSWLRDEMLEEQLSYWRQRMMDAPPILELPLDRPRPAVQSFHGKSQSITLTKTLSERLKALCKQENVTTFMLMLAAFKALLYYYTQQEDIVVSTGIATRNRREIENLIGYFVNTLVLRTDLSGSPSFRQLLRRVREVTLGAFDHQDLPLETLVEALQPARNPGISPLFQVMFVLQNVAAEEQESAELPGLTMRLFAGRAATAKFDLTLFIQDGTGHFKVTLEYNTDLFNASTIAKMLGYFKNLLAAITQNPDEELDDISLTTDEENQQLIESWA
jgi:non-ribosomal peptide synthetase component F